MCAASLLKKRTLIFSSVMQNWMHFKLLSAIFAALVDIHAFNKNKTYDFKK